ncbi:hypothetical protein [Chroococcus sp. FPU101]|uniref:hypothetical protein n=1 Tax=Chroococcus sp. FPU101 TaxID=1974212 RepID=UPI001A8D12D3|nr:hypothetical protein [Chroococcus sp. FPU101]GFE68750.1 hypothetical protein CFPU101_13600 [Chroococcus sp. FPU101]
MARVSSEPLQPNPFTTYRDPNTGAWIVVKSQLNLDISSEQNLKSSPIYSSHEQSSPVKSN